MNLAEKWHSAPCLMTRGSDSGSDINGFGRSDTCANLRRFLEVDRHRRS